MGRFEDVLNGDGEKNKKKKTMRDEQFGRGINTCTMWIDDVVLPADLLDGWGGMGG